MDWIYLAAIAAFLILAVGLASGCRKLGERK